MNKTRGTKYSVLIDVHKHQYLLCGWLVGCLEHHANKVKVMDVGFLHLVPWLQIDFSSQLAFLQTSASDHKERYFK